LIFSSLFLSIGNLKETAIGMHVTLSNWVESKTVWVGERERGRDLLVIAGSKDERTGNMLL
jgi:hypothetical protein